MIRRIEISEAARAWGLSQHVVEKDYVIGWLLMGLAYQAQLQTQWNHYQLKAQLYLAALSQAFHQLRSLQSELSRQLSAA